MILKLLKNIRERHNFKRRLKKADTIIYNFSPLLAKKHIKSTYKPTNDIYDDIYFQEILSAIEEAGKLKLPPKAPYL